MIPKRVSTLAVCVLLVFGLCFYIRPQHILSPWSLRRGSARHLDPSLHRVEYLHLVAKEEHESMISRQSKTYEQAVSQYRSRYEQDPPNGFEAWYQKAVEWNSPIIDDFDDIVHQLRPFRSSLRNRCDEPEFGNDPSSERSLIQLCFRNGEIEQYGWREKWWEEALEHMTADFKHTIPDICINLNYLDEPRLIVPQHLLDAEETHSSTALCHPLNFVNMKHQNIWPEATANCPLDSIARGRPGAALTATLPTNRPLYAESFSNTTNLCNYDRTLPQGLLRSSSSLRLSHDPVPILSPSKLSPFTDILFPAPFRFDAQSTYKAEEDIPWESKNPILHWRGSSTGGHAEGDNWQHFHRQHIIKTLTEKANPAIDVAFTSFTQCEPPACAAQKEAFDLANRTDMPENWFYKYILDLDGNGLSGRLYDLLRSGSLVVRQTFTREWHDSRLRAWVHYIPLTPGVGEVEELLGFLGTERGEGVARGIAEEGRKWVGEALRREDMALYFWRVVLEMGRGREGG